MSYSGDSPFLLRLVLGMSNEKAKVYPSRLPLYVTDKNFLPTNTDIETGKRMQLEVPFRQDVPQSALVYMEDVRSVSPDATHMITRCVERDLKRMAQKIVDDNHPNEDHPIRNFENNLTKREAKKPYFAFNRTTPQNKPGKVSSVSLSGSEALTVIADEEELQEASNEITPLFHGVWTDEDPVTGSGNNHFVDCVRVLKEMFPGLFRQEDGRISMYDASELLRKSLNRCVILLRDSKNGLSNEFSKWAEAYYQTSLLLFGEKGLTPYKLKLMLFPSLVQSGFVATPWYHMCEGLEKSNHHAHKAFQTRTMRGGGRIHHQDPLFLELCFSFCKFLELAKPKNRDCSEVLDGVSQAVRGCSLENLPPAPTYLDICKRPLQESTIAVGEARERGMLLAGMHFFVIGNFGGTAADEYGKRVGLQPQQTVEHWIKQLGGEVFKDKSALETVMHGSSRTPHCFVVLKNAEELNNGTMTKEERVAFAAAAEAAAEAAEAAARAEAVRQGKKPPPRKRRRVAPPSESDGSVGGKETAKFKKLHPTAKLCRELAGADLTFLRLEYVTNSLKSDVVLDPYSEQFRLVPGSHPNVKKVTVKDVRPLLLHQTSQVETTARTSVIVALKRHRKMTMKNATQATEEEISAEEETGDEIDAEENTGDEMAGDSGDDWNPAADDTDDEADDEEEDTMLIPDHS